MGWFTIYMYMTIIDDNPEIDRIWCFRFDLFITIFCSGPIEISLFYLLQESNVGRPQVDMQPRLKAFAVMLRGGWVTRFVGSWDWQRIMGYVIQRLQWYISISWYAHIIGYMMLELVFDITSGCSDILDMSSTIWYLRHDWKLAAIPFISINMGKCYCLFSPHVRSIKSIGIGMHA